MSKLKKLLAIGLATVAATSAIAFTGCGGGENFIKDGKTINVRICKQGWGDDYFRAWAGAFEDLYSAEGYKINIVESSTSVEAQYVSNELALGNKNGVDLYCSGQCTVARIVQVSLDEGFTIAADLSDVMNSKPINAYGEEESKTLLQKLESGFADQMTMNSSVAVEAVHNGKWYTFPVVSSTSSLVVNVPTLTSYGLEIPVTTNELIDCFDQIKNGNGVKGGSATTGVYPTVWAGKNAYNYWLPCFNLWYAQYSGKQAIEEFYNMDNCDTNEKIAALYDKTQNLGMYNSLKVMEVMTDLDNAPNGTIGWEHGKAQNSLLTNQAVFMANGEWLQNEMGANYASQTGNMKMIKMPVISALGVKLGLDGNNGADADKCETVLSAVIKAIDAGDDNAKIVTDIAAAHGVTLDATTQVEEVRKARGIYTQGGTTSQIVLNPYSDVLDIAKLFLRFIASDDGINYLYTYSTAKSAFKPIDASAIDYNNASGFLQSCAEISDRPYATAITGLTRPGAKRTTTNIGTFNNTIFSGVDWIKAMGQMSTSSDGLTAAKLMDEELRVVKQKLGM